MKVINLPSELLIKAVQKGSNIELEALAGWLLLSANFGSSMLREASINKISKFWKVGYNKAKEILAYGLRTGVYKYSKRIGKKYPCIMSNVASGKALAKYNQQGSAVRDLIAVSLPKTSTLIKFGVYDTKNEATGKYLFIIPNDDEKLADTLSKLTEVNKRQSIRLVVKMLKVVCLLMLDKSRCQYDSLLNKQYEKAAKEAKRPDVTESKECMLIDAPVDLDARITEDYIREQNIGTSLETLSEKLGKGLFSKSSIYRIKKFGMEINALTRKKVILCVRDFTNYKPKVTVDYDRAEAIMSSLTGIAALFQDHVLAAEVELAEYMHKARMLDVYSVSGRVSYNGINSARMWEGKTSGSEEKWFMKLSDVIEPTCRLFGSTHKA